MGKVIYSDKFKAKVKENFEHGIDFSIIADFEQFDSNSNVVLRPQIKKWEDYTYEEKIKSLIEEKFRFHVYLEYISLCRFYKQFDESVKMETYQEWLEDLIQKGCYTV